MKENPANTIKDTMWKFLMDKGQKSNISALKEYVYDLIEMTTQKTAGQRKIKDHISWDELDMTIMSIAIEATALVLSGDLDKKKEANKDMNAYTNASWIPVEECLPEDGTDVLVVLKPTYESDYIEYSIARYLHFENDEAHWCDNHYGYLEWEKYSGGRGGSSWYRVVAWQKLDSYHPERSEE